MVLPFCILKRIFRRNTDIWISYSFLDKAAEGGPGPKAPKAHRVWRTDRILYHNYYTIYFHPKPIEYLGELCMVLPFCILKRIFRKTQSLNNSITHLTICFVVKFIWMIFKESFSKNHSFNETIEYFRRNLRGFSLFVF